MTAEGGGAAVGGEGAGSGAAAVPGTTGGRLQRATMWMAAGTGVSRLTGLLRVVALAYALGINHLSDAYNLANTTPNMLYDIVLGGILSATFIPVFVDRLATRSEREAWRAISSIVTIAVTVLVVMTVVLWIVAPQLIDAYTAFDHVHRAAGASLAQEKAVASTLLRWFVPQVALYGFLALMTALLNTRRRFAAPMWVPIANNLVVIGVLLWFHALVSTFRNAGGALAAIHAHPEDLLLLGLGTTLGVALQAAMLVPHLRGVGLGRVLWRWDPRHEAVATVARLGGWTLGFVVANQVALYVVLALAVSAGSGVVSSYTYAYTFMQMPYAVVAVSIMSAVTPDLAERWATGDVERFRLRLVNGLRATLAVILPAAVGMLVLAKPAVALLLGHGVARVSNTGATGSALAMFAIGLPGFCAYLYIVRVLQAMQRTKVAFWLYLVENGINIALAAVLVGPLGVRGLALSLTIAYSVSAVVGLVVLRRWLGTLGGARSWSPLRRVAGATVVMGVVVLVVSNLSGADHGLGLLLRVGGSVAAGIVVYGGLGLLLGGRRRPMALLTGESLGAPPDGGGLAGGPGRGARLARGLGRSAGGVAGGVAGAGVGLGGGLGAGVGLDDAWGDSRTPAYTGPRVRIVPAPDGGGRPVGRATGSGGQPVRKAKPAPSAVPVPKAKPAPSAVPARRAPSAAGHVGAVEPAVAAGARRAGGVDPSTPVPEGDESDQRADDDPGERRWIGGTTTSLRHRPPR